MAASKGMWDMGGMFQDFYKNKNDDPDIALAQKAFQGNAMQSVMDNQMAMQLGQFNSGLAQSNMTHQADLEQRNAAALMKDEFNYGMQSMEAQAKLQNEAANAQHTRDLGMSAAQGEQQRKNISASGQQDRLGTIVAGEQARLQQDMVNKSNEAIAKGEFSTERYKADSAADASKYGADAQKDASNYMALKDKEKALGVADIQSESAQEVASTQAKASTDVATTQAKASTDVASTQAKASTDVATTAAEADKAVATTAAEASKYGADQQLAGVKDTNTTSTENIKETGNQSRLTEDNSYRNKAKERANMHQYARSTARAM